MARNKEFEELLKNDKNNNDYINIKKNKFEIRTSKGNIVANMPFLTSTIGMGVGFGITLTSLATIWSTGNLQSAALTSMTGAGLAQVFKRMVDKTLDKADEEGLSDFEDELKTACDNGLEESLENKSRFEIRTKKGKVIANSSIFKAIIATGVVLGLPLGNLISTSVMLPPVAAVSAVAGFAAVLSSKPFDKSDAKAEEGKTSKR